MRNFSRILSVLAGLCVIASAWAYAPAPSDAPDKKPAKEELEQAKKLVDDALAKAGGRVTVQPIADDVLYRTFPGYIFYSVVFPQFPLAREVPDPYKSANVYAIRRGKEMKPELLSEPKKLEAFFKSNLKAVESEDQAKDAVRAWLSLSPVLLQDGFYTFALMDDSTKAVKDKRVESASGKCVVMKGGNGEINVTLQFDDKGVLAKIEEVDKITPGPRPICQATKLLDTDAIVRRMAEQDLLIMGAAAKDYLTEQRAKASPELQKAIDRIWQRIVDEKR